MQQRVTTFHNRAVFLLSLCGLLVAGYVLQGYLRDESPLCVNSGCDIVRKSSYSNIFGMPVPAFGLIGYASISVLAFFRTFNNSGKLAFIHLLVATLGVLFVAWFSYLEVFVIKAICMWCVISAIIMISLWSVLFIEAKGKKA